MALTWTCARREALQARCRSEELLDGGNTFLIYTLSIHLRFDADLCGCETRPRKPRKSEHSDMKIPTSWSKKKQFSYG